jgi:hypothetical protein
VSDRRTDIRGMGRHMCRTPHRGRGCLCVTLIGASYSRLPAARFRDRLLPQTRRCKRRIGEWISSNQEDFPVVIE